jgi:enamine deaminase RidA (YjgF/YER057c/UK114 family)
MPSSIVERLRELAIELPTLPKPGGSYVPFRRHGDLVYLAGQTSSRDGKAVYSGPLHGPDDLERGYDAARLCAVNLLAALKLACDGDLDRVGGCLKVNGYVLAAPTFESVPAVVNGASDLLVEVFGEAGRHARTAVGVAVLPRNVTVEVEATFFLKT